MLASCSERWFFSALRRIRRKRIVYEHFLKTYTKTSRYTDSLEGKKYALCACLSVYITLFFIHCSLSVDGKWNILSTVSAKSISIVVYSYISFHIYFFFPPSFSFPFFPSIFFFSSFSLPIRSNFVQFPLFSWTHAPAHCPFENSRFHISVFCSLFCNTCNLMQGTSTKIPLPQTTRWSSSKEDKINDNINPLFSFNWNIPKLNCKC